MNEPDFLKNDQFWLEILLLLSFHLKIVLRKLVELLYVSENVLEHARLAILKILSLECDLKWKSENWMC